MCVLLAKTGFFDKSNATSTPFDETITGIGFQPKAIIMWSTSTNGVTDHIRSGFGFADGQIPASPNQRACGWASQDDVAVTQTQRMDSETLIWKGFAAGSGGVGVEIQLKETTADGWIHTYVNNNTSVFRIYYLALGGDDITAVKAGTFNAPTTQTGAQSVGGVGFRPDFVLFATTAATSTIGTAQVGARFSVGFASFASGSQQQEQHKQSVISTVSQNNTDPSSARRRVSTSKVVSLLDVVSNTSNVILEGSVTEAHNDGFNLNWNVANNPTFEAPVFYLAVRGGQWDVQPLEFPMEIGTQNITTASPNDVVFQPEFAFLFTQQNSIPVGNDTRTDTQASMALGCGTSPSEMHSVWMSDRHAVSPTISARSSTNAAVIQTRTSAMPNGADSNVNRSATLQSINSDGYTLNYNTITSGATAGVVLISVAAGSSLSVVQKELTAVYNIQKLVEKDLTCSYNMGGMIFAGPYIHSYNILGKIRKELTAVYNIHELVTKDLTAVYNIQQAIAGLIQKLLTCSYNIEQFVRKDLGIIYNIHEDPSLNLRGYLKPLQFRMFIMSNDMKRLYHVINMFDPEETTISVESLHVDTSNNFAGAFRFVVEDSRHIIDTTEVGNGNAVLIQAAKTESALNDGRHNLLIGYIKSYRVERPATNILRYEFEGYGSMIRFNERLTSFNKSARRVRHDDPTPDTSDISMQSWRLFRDLVTTTDHLPFGGPREPHFSIRGVLNPPGGRVDAFVPSINEDLSEWSSVADLIAETGLASWGVDAMNDVFLRYATLQPSGIVIKDRIEPTDDRFRTSYFHHKWEFIDTTDKGQGFSNRFAVKIGTKSGVRSNIINIQNMANQFTPLATDNPSTDAESGRPVESTTKANLGPIIVIRPDLIGPNNVVWTQIANLATQFHFNLFYITVKFGSGIDGPGPSPGDPAWVTEWNRMVNAGVRPLGYIDTQGAFRSEASIRAEIDRWRDQWGPTGIYFDNVVPNTNHISYYHNISTYAKVTRGFSVVFANAGQQVPEAFFVNCPNINTFIIRESPGLPNFQTDLNVIPQEWWSAHHPNRRAILSHSVTTSSASDDDIGRWVDDMFLENIARFTYITHKAPPQPYDVLSNRMMPMMFALERAAIRLLQDLGFIIPNVPVQQDVSMSFLAKEPKINDFAIIVSKIGDVSPVRGAGELPNHVYGEILDNRVVVRAREDPTTGEITSELVDMPRNTRDPIGEIRIPINQIQEQFPTVVFFNNVVRQLRDIVLNQRYWVVLYGRGRDERNTIRWHHADDASGADSSYKVGIRVPTAHRHSTAQWGVFSSSSHPGLALSYFRNTLMLLEASDPDSRFLYGPIESKLDLSGITDDSMAARVAHSILNFSAKPKRIYSMQTITAPDELILPGHLVHIQDEMTTTGQVAGSTMSGTEAEIASTSYDWDATRDPEGCRYINIQAIGHLDPFWAYWKAKFDRGEISVDFPEIEPSPPSPDPQVPSAPVVIARPRGGSYNSSVAVKFVTDRTNVRVMYTRNGVVPANLVSAGGSTFQYNPGTSTDIIINTSTLLRFRGIDNSNINLKSAVYSEDYKIIQPPPPPPPPPSPTPPPPSPPPVVGGKIMWPNFNLAVNLTTQVNTFAAHLNSSMDNVTLEKLPNQTITTAAENAVLVDTRSKFQDVQFRSIPDMQAYIPTAKAKGWDIMCYNMEPSTAPKSEKDDVVKAHKRFSEIVKKQGLKVRFNPDRRYSDLYVSRIAKFCDSYNIQAQQEQHDPKRFNKLVKETAASLRTNNSKVFITITLSAHAEREKGKSILQTMIDRWIYARRHCDGVRIFFANSTQLTTTVASFMNWFKNNGRSMT